MINKYIDSNVFIYSLVASLNDDKTIFCRKILFSIIRKEINAFTSFLTWDEVVYNLKKKLGRNLALSHGEKFLYFPNLNFIKVDRQTIILAQKLMNTYEINPRDAIHAATALTVGVKEIISDDKDFDKIKDIKRIGIGKN